MKIKLFTLLAVLVGLFASFVSCNDDMTYGDMRKAENKAVESFIKNGCRVLAEDGKTDMLYVKPIQVISEDEFNARLEHNEENPESPVVLTDTEKNEYVLFAGSGAYMQIVRQGTGAKISEGESCKVLCRYHEYNISTDSLQSSNRVPDLEQYLDVMNITNTSGTYTGAFSPGGSMYIHYGSAVPGGWLIPLKFLNLGRQDEENAEVAMVRLIVPSGEGHSYASQGVYACFYEIIMQRGRK